MRSHPSDHAFGLKNPEFQTNTTLRFSKTVGSQGRLRSEPLPQMPAISYPFDSPEYQILRRCQPTRRYLRYPVKRWVSEGDTELPALPKTRLPETIFQ